MATTMRAKLKIETINRTKTTEEIKFYAVTKTAYPEDGNDENNTFARFSPTANLSLTITNPELLGKFNPGESFYVDFTPAD